MVEHLVCNQAVVGSNPVASTNPGAPTGAREVTRQALARAAPRGHTRACRKRPPAWRPVIFENKV